MKPGEVGAAAAVIEGYQQQVRTCTNLKDLPTLGKALGRAVRPAKTSKWVPFLLPLVPD